MHIFSTWPVNILDDNPFFKGLAIGVAKRASPPHIGLQKCGLGWPVLQSYCGLEFSTRPA